ncbi:MAG: AraC family transcriptional regulator [Actinocatenispora sp.]
MTFTDTTGQRAGPVRSQFETSDLDEAREFLVAAYGTGMRMWCSRGGFRMRHASLDAGPFRIDTASGATPTCFATEPGPALAICRLEDGTLERDAGGMHERFGPGDTFVLAVPNLPYVERWDSATMSMTVIAAEVVAGVAGGCTGADPGTLEFTGSLPVSAAAQQRWGRTVEHLADDLMTNPEAMGEPFIVGNAARLLAASALSTFPNTAMSDGQPGDRVDAGPEALRRAIAFIDTNAHLDIGLEDIAVAGRVTTRALRYTFRRHLDTCPSAYLRRVRMDRARRDLIYADPTATTVSAIAARWGFLHQGRFAATYRDVYHESPRATLHT